MSVSAIAAYLAFFPVSVGALRGLQSPAPATVELFDSYAASWRQTLVKVRFPASIPYLVPALRLAAAASVVGRHRRRDLHRQAGRHRAPHPRVLAGGHVRSGQGVHGDDRGRRARARGGRPSSGSSSVYVMRNRPKEAAGVTAADRAEPLAVAVHGLTQGLQRRPAQRGAGARRHRPRDPPRRVRVAHRPVRLRQEHAAAPRGQPHRAHERDGRGQREVRPPGPPRPGLRDGLPAVGPARVALRGPQHRAAARAAEVGQGPPAQAGAGDAGAREAAGVRRPPPVGAVGRHAAAGGHRPGPGLRPGRCC